MKKWSYIVGGFVLGVAVALAGSTAYAEVQSLIGKKSYRGNDCNS
ncbi:hypothetical protein HMSSN139_67580 [Paenibacillus sp. HMSSN-139]|nr:hypothetical protein HMSSN139_67580 [Paenibacillus sp. HMSSN-139]